MNELLWITAGGLLMSAIALAGGITVFMRSATLDRILLPLVSLAAGTLLGGAFFHMVPTGMLHLSAIEAGIWLLTGFTVFLGLEQFLHWHHSHRGSLQQSRRPMTYLILIGDGLHNFLGGLGIASTFLINPHAGIYAWLAAAAHEIPQEIGDFGILVHGGWRRKQALLWNLISGLMFLLGSLCAYYLSMQFEVAGLIMFGAGNFIYIAASDLVPEIKANETFSGAFLHFAMFAAGILLMLYLTSVFR